jgi:hypothetical protein
MDDNSRSRSRQLEEINAMAARSTFEKGLTRFRALISFIQPTLSSLLWNPSPPETQSRQVWTSDLLIQTLLALLPYFLAQRQSQVRESRDAHIRVKSMNAAQQMIH